MSVRTMPEVPVAIPEGIEVTGVMRPGYDEILTPEALLFLARLHRRFEPRRRALLEARTARQTRIDAGEMPDFPEETRAIRESEWTVAPIPPDLRRRAVEITGPVDRKMIINALNSGADVFMADFEDSTSPTWSNVVEGQINLRDAVRGTIRFVNDRGRVYELGDETATLMVRPRGWHLVERHLRVDGAPISASLFDFGLFFFHNARALVERGSGPYFYLPKLESHHEARLWNDIFVLAQEHLRIPRGTIRATVLIETILAAFEMDEILWELREHSAGLNCGRWDYIFSVIKKFRNRPGWVLPDRAQITMQSPMMRAYSQLTIRTCHRRGIHAMGGMAAQIPIRSDPEANRRALEKVRVDKEREVGDGHDGTWVAHPGLVPVARAAFGAMMGDHQIDRRRDDVEVGAAELLAIPEGTITEAGVRTNISVGVRYLGAWLRGSGCVPIDHLMEDAATAEISRSQLWQWVRSGATTTDGRAITPARFNTVLRQTLDGLRASMGDAAYETGRYEQAGELFRRMTLAPDFSEFLTLDAYDHL